MTAQSGVIIPMPPQVVDPAVKETLGAKISALVQSYNSMKAALKDTTPEATKVQFDQLLEKRRAAVEAILAAHKATLDEVLGVGHTAKLAGLGYQYKLGRHWRLGGALTAIHSQTYNDGHLVVAPVPILTYDLRAVKLNAIYVPRYGEYNEFAVFGLYFSLPLGW